MLMMDLRTESLVNLQEDVHMHSTFSDGKHSVVEMYEAAAARGLERICFADHVRQDTKWLPEYVEVLRGLGTRGAVAVGRGVEAKMLDESGKLDLPEEVSGIEVILIADHRLPLGNECLGPQEVLRRLNAGSLTPHRVFEALIDATARASVQEVDVVVAHLFSFLPKVGLSESEIPERLLIRLARDLVASKAQVEVSERWRCPGPRSLEILAREGVHLVASTDSHSKDTVGVYCWVENTVHELQRRGVS